MNKCSKLTIEERRKLYKYRDQGLSKRAIGRELSRAASTIKRELDRNATDVDRDEFSYVQARQAQEATHQRRVAASKKKMRLKCVEIRNYVEEKLSNKWSPEIISGRLKIDRPEHSISDEAIYQFLLHERPDLREYLLVAGKARRRRIPGKRRRFKKLPAAPKRSIEVLPMASVKRTEIGHLELDAIIGKRGKSALQNKTDRKSRKMFLDKANSLVAKDYADILIERVKKDIPVIHTILEDNGVEHADHQRVDKILGCLSHFCHPYCSSERGTVENRNGAIRRFFPKGTDFDDIPDEFIKWVEDYFNNKPMKILGFQTPNEIWFAELRTAA